MGGGEDRLARVQGQPGDHTTSGGPGARHAVLCTAHGDDQPCRPRDDLTLMPATSPLLARGSTFRNGGSVSRLALMEVGPGRSTSLAARP